MPALLMLTLCSLGVAAGASAAPSVTSFRPSSWVLPAMELEAVGPETNQDCCVVEDMTSLLQLRVSMPQNGTLMEDPEKKIYMRGGGPGMPFQCGQKHEKDLYRPVLEVLAEHPGIDGNCYFQFAAFWIGYSPLTDYTAKARGGAMGMRQNPETCQGWKGHNSAPESTAHFELGTVTSHLDCGYYTYDDLYFYSLGWLKNQRLDGSLMTNATAWRALAAEECAMIQAEYHFTPEETTVGKLLDDNPGICTHSACAWGPANSPCKRATVREFKLHVYTKCLLGHAADEMAYGYMRACLLPGNVIGHGDACGICPDGKVCP